MTTALRVVCRSHEMHELGLALVLGACWIVLVLWADLGKLVSLAAVYDPEVVMLVCAAWFTTFTLLRASSLVALVIGWDGSDPFILRM